jgi:hypothetical protein
MKIWMVAVLSTIVIGTAVVAKEQDTAKTSARTPVVLELFTSEGCSSCPPADRLLEALDEKQPFPGADLIVLSEHVDYWNNGGWRDPFSSKAFSQRQSFYAEQLHLDDIYTPQLVVDGQREFVGSNAAKAKLSIEEAIRSRKVALMLSNISRAGKDIHAHINSAELPDEYGPATVFVALAEDKVRSEVQNGENTGRSLTHVAVVRVLTPVASIQSGAEFSKDIILPLPSASHSTKLRVVAFIQTKKSHQIVGAVQSKL